MSINYPLILQLGQLLKVNTRPLDTDLSRLEKPIDLTVTQKIDVIFSSKVITQEQKTSPVKPYESVSIQRFEISHHSTPKKINTTSINGKLHTIEKSKKRKKYSLEFKQKAVSEVCSGQSISQVSKKHGIYYNSLKTWMKKAYDPNLPYNSSEAWTLKDRTKDLSSKVRSFKNTVPSHKDIF